MTYAAAAVDSYEFAHTPLLASSDRYDAAPGVLADEGARQGRVSISAPRDKVSLVFDRSVTPW
ncbi:hypothetical protein GCM10010121_068780 [Streptomyces brasiliensis]|uniref:Uncharacterized protein n=1 Tax=Streptomyces brasiliensis TaxID=1954 RepID=A0A917LA03_9ACTN|nr:hypothetical protein GCM10010121_068780 [Streptomyces brasiliensis]